MVSVEGEGVRGHAGLFIQQEALGCVLPQLLRVRPTALPAL